MMAGCSSFAEGVHRAKPRLFAEEKISEMKGVWPRSQAGRPLVERRSQRIIILLLSLDAAAYRIGGRLRQPKA